MHRAAFPLAVLGCFVACGGDDAGVAGGSEAGAMNGAGVGGSAGAGAAPWGGSSGHTAGGAPWGGSAGTGSGAATAGGGTQASGGSGGGVACSGEGPAFIHGDLWAFWHNTRVACDAQRRWHWICEQRLGAGNCPEEAAWFQQCWSATGAFPKTSWTDSEGHNYPEPHSANWGVCQPPHFPEKNDANRRPANPTPCDASSFDYGALRTLDPFYGLDWWTGATGMRHLTLKVYEAHVDPLASEGLADGLINLSTHPGSRDAFMDGLDNHTYSGSRTGGGCLPSFSGDNEEPYPAQNFGAFFWLEVPTDRPLTIGATWQGRTGGNISDGCVNPLYTFPSSFGGHAEPGKPWFISNPCWDFNTLQLEPGRHYIWDVSGLRLLPDCSGLPEELLSVVPEAEREALRDGSCAG